jgi:3-oxoacyl-[acyl-carrier protein] reductase
MEALTGKTALVTGGSRGIGRAIAQRLARDGARIAVHYNDNDDAAKQTVAAIEAAGGSAFALRAPLGVPGGAEALWTAFDAHADGVDVLVNNAGIVDRRPIETIPEDEYDRTFAVNTKAPFFVTRLGLSRLRDGGRIVNITTGLTRRAEMPDLVVYAMSKAGVDTLTINLAKQLGPRGITVNAVAPGITATDMNADWRHGPEVLAHVATMSPLQRVGEPADIADIVAFLASDDARWITGQWIDATGGALV